MSTNTITYKSGMSYKNLTIQREDAESQGKIIKITKTYPPLDIKGKTYQLILEIQKSISEEVFTKKKTFYLKHENQKEELNMDVDSKLAELFKNSKKCKKATTKYHK